jgi:hypothetical protein
MTRSCASPWRPTGSKYSPSHSDNALGQADPGFWAVFTRYAVAAGVASQVDSPAPGPGDVVAVGNLVIGLIDAGLIGGQILSSIVDTAPITGPTAAPPIPRVAPTAVPAPTVVPTVIPTAIPTVVAAPNKFEKKCMPKLVECLESPNQPEWNQGDFGLRKNCNDCYQLCINRNKGNWPDDKCPSPGTKPGTTN